MDSKKIDFVISVRDRDNERIQRCIDSLYSENVNKIIVVDYGSKEKVNVQRAEIIRVETKNVWNKSHALNIGIKACNSDFIGTIDCDIIVNNDFLKKVEEHLKEDCFILTRYVRRIDPFYFDSKFDEQLKHSIPWIEGVGRLNHEACGGIQIFPKSWIHKIKGYDESLIYWGGIDNDIYERAIRSGLRIIDINLPILHQEHQNIKEDNLDEKERKKAVSIRMNRRNYLIFKEKKGIIVGPDIWGDKIPSQNYGKEKEFNSLFNTENIIIMDKLKEIINENPLIKPTTEELGKRLREGLGLE